MAEPGQYLVWRRGQALMAVPLAEVVEVARVRDGQAKGRTGELGLLDVPGLVEGPDRAAPEMAVLVRSGADVLALPADDVEGVLATESGVVANPPAWLAGVARAAVRGLVRLSDDRIVAVVDVGTLAET